jgi:hypothetical protein
LFFPNAPLVRATIAYSSSLFIHTPLIQLIIF